MAGIVSVSRADLQGRRKKLRQQRQMKFIRAAWRTFAVSSLASGLLWVTIQPIWVLKTSKDIVILGNHLLPDEVVQSRLVLSYPQSLWRIEPYRLAESLKQEPTIAQATVSRRLFPPGLVVQIDEREPVAIAERVIRSNSALQDCPVPSTQGKSSPTDCPTEAVFAIAPTRTKQGNKGSINKKVSVGLLDANGVWMPLGKEKALNPNVQLPKLKVIGSPEQYRPYWTQLYQAITQSSVHVLEIDFQDPTNLILKTELGNVHFGAPNFQLLEKIKVLAQMRHLPAQLNPSQIEYIDLKNPDSPIVQMNQKKRLLNAPRP
ncbi:cell division protein FtsQ [Scytonema hofmannii PCC 7110]|uniref:Cell division protein FtsQ n=1 Tax=Scytonema hofmannii PCC 7110 TaxID=128403 RepID=A0A139X6Q2_9CYAN|nr:FtsQ-type POTRA domain-containing protein [Scytonema hofmannii]KYC40302.1 cell division protein FtsQ [Scytonema hofmannii PCC 7110]